MSEAPERIWWNGVRGEGGYTSTVRFAAGFEYVRADRIEELEAKLAKAVEALEFYRSAINLRIDCEITYAMQEAHDNAETFLAELKGETDA
jgi:hypothetical protein